MSGFVWAFITTTVSVGVWALVSHVVLMGVGVFSPHEPAYCLYIISLFFSCLSTVFGFCISLWCIFPFCIVDGAWAVLVRTLSTCLHAWLDGDFPEAPWRNKKKKRITADVFPPSHCINTLDCCRPANCLIFSVNRNAHTYWWSADEFHLTISTWLLLTVFISMVRVSQCVALVC